MVTGARSHWGLEKGGSTCRKEARSGSDRRPHRGAMVWAGRGLSALRPIRVREPEN